MKAVFALLAASAALLAAAPAMAHIVVYTTPLSGAAEDPPNASPGSGTARITVDDHAFSMRVQASFSDLSGQTTAAHIHCCTALAEAGTAGVATMVPSFAGFPLGVAAGSYDNSFDMTLASSWNPAFLTANGGSTANAFSSLVTGLNQGTAYFNVHSNAFPGGEVRGFLAVTPIPEPQTYALMLAGLAAVGIAAKRRRR